MIIYDLECTIHHRFEGWFKNKDDYESQLAAGMLLCPVCHSAEVRKIPSASYINTRSSNTTTHMPEGYREVMGKIPDANINPATNPESSSSKLTTEAVREIIDHHFDNVGDKFTEEVKKIHYGEVEGRNIYGSATLDEVLELSDEGIETIPLLKPWDKDKLN